MSLVRLTKRLADLDAERARVLIAIEVTQALDPHAKDAGTTLAAKALAHVNGHGAPAAAAGEAGTGQRLAAQHLVTEFLREHGPQTLAAIVKGTPLPNGTVSGTLRNMRKRTGTHPTLVKQIGRGHGSRWALVGERAKKGTATTKGRGKHKKKLPREKRGALKNAIAAVLQAHKGPITFADLRDTLRERGVVTSKQGGRSVGVVLAATLAKKGLVKSTREGWVWTGPNA